MPAPALTSSWTSSSSILERRYLRRPTVPLAMMSLLMLFMGLPSNCTALRWGRRPREWGSEDSELFVRSRRSRHCSFTWSRGQMNEERRSDHLSWQTGDIVVPEVESSHTGDAFQVLRGHYRDPAGTNKKHLKSTKCNQKLKLYFEEDKIPKKPNSSK